ncbi:MAG: hypothetical protein JWO37_1827 [Acidimicrobiales bacterium]|jgi:hypothetical protein|nr:hypothetical protein [Acidimicrobiales bacterium]
MSLSWIPSEAIGGAMRMPFDAGFTHYDEPPPDHIEDIEKLRDADRFRFANVLRAWIEVDADGRIEKLGYDGGGLMGSTTVRVPGLSHTFEAVALPDIQREPELVAGGTAVRFVQTCGGRTGLPAPRRVRRKPFLQWSAPLVWSTLALTIRNDGTSSLEVLGASRFPRHWVYDETGNLAAKSGLTDFKDWYRKSFGKHTPWGDEESPALVTAVETALERALSTRIMRGGAKPKVKKVKAGKLLAEQGAEATELYLVLDGVVRIEHDGERLAEFGPGALLGERAALEGGRRTSTMVAVTNCRVAVAAFDDIDRSALEELSTGHRREDGSRS